MDGNSLPFSSEEIGVEIVGQFVADKWKTDIRHVLGETMATNSEIVKTLQCYNTTNVDFLTRCGNNITLLIKGEIIVDDDNDFLRVLDKIML